MKFKISIFTVLAAGLIISGCGDQGPVSPDLNQNVQDEQKASLVKATVTEFTATGQSTGIIDPGTITPVGNRIRVNGLTGSARYESQDPHWTGDMIFVVNAVWDANGTGPVWGTFTLELDQGGVWQGSFSGRRTQVGASEWLGSLRWVARKDGSKAHGTENIHTFALLPVEYVSELEGQIVEH